MGFYPPLENKTPLEIRLIHLEESTNPAAEIRCQLLPYSLFNHIISEENPMKMKYEALSYTWGNEENQSPIYVNNIEIKVKPNLESFLRQRREPAATVCLWIDALCIDQEDDEEKNQQIPLMKFIYSLASKLTIWLGSQSDDSDLAIKSLKQLGQGASPYDKMPILEDDQVIAIQNIFNRPWWSRVWIVQELAMGGMVRKQNTIAARCGSATITWISLVVAAARMKAYASDQRQAFPDVSNILELDCLRESIPSHTAESPTASDTFDLICRYRHFHASEPKDKIYALHNMFPGGDDAGIKTRYDAAVKDVFADFAVRMISTDLGVEVLRHCGSRAEVLPSWVPDWTVSLGTEPLPVRTIRRYTDVPWWADPIYLDVNEHKEQVESQKQPRIKFQTAIGKSPEEARENRRKRLKQLEIGAAGSGIVQDLDEVPHSFGFTQGMPPDAKEELQDALRHGGLVLCVEDGRGKGPEGVTDALKQGEVITERRMKTWLLHELTGSDTVTRFETWTATGASITFTEGNKVLESPGILFDTVEECHEPFVREIDKTWENATRFMVAVGCCKAMAMNSVSAIDRYPTTAERMLAFWSTLLAGQEISDSHQDSEGRSPFTDWLPEISKDWTPERPPLTATTAGLVELVQMREAYEIAIESHQDASLLSVPDIDGMEGSIPKSWTQVDMDKHQETFNHLASTWKKQPYDLYHRPFDLYHVVPDPFWDTRKKQNEQADSAGMDHLILQQGNPDDPTVNKIALELQTKVKHLMETQPSMIPKSSLKRGAEKYALGRRFFITAKGYFGIGPTDMREGDSVASLNGSPVPFVLRRASSDGSGSAWSLIGETYVHDIMQGQLVREWELGKLESRKIRLI